MSGVPVVATRVRKARFESTCPMCRGPVRIGTLIARCPGNLWVHASCYLGHKHNLDSSEAPASTTGASALNKKQAHPS